MARKISQLYICFIFALCETPRKIPDLSNKAKCYLTLYPTDWPTNMRHHKKTQSQKWPIPRGFAPTFWLEKIAKKNIDGESGCSGGHRGGSHHIFWATDWPTNMRHHKKTQSQKCRGICTHILGFEISDSVIFWIFFQVHQLAASLLTELWPFLSVCDNTFSPRVVLQSEGFVQSIDRSFAARVAQHLSCLLTQHWLCWLSQWPKKKSVPIFEGTPLIDLFTGQKNKMPY